VSSEISAPEKPTAIQSPVQSGFELLGEEFLSPPELSNLITKTERTLEWWRETKQGPAFVRVGKTILYKKTSVLKWLSDQEVQPRRPRKAAR
jgi:hypothetical protein